MEGPTTATEVMRIHGEDKRRAAILGALRGESAADFIHRAVDFYVEHNRVEIDAAFKRAQRMALTTDLDRLGALAQMGVPLDTPTTPGDHDTAGR